jgi:hypothetical protein
MAPRGVGLARSLNVKNSRNLKGRKYCDEIKAKKKKNERSRNWERILITVIDGIGNEAAHSGTVAGGYHSADVATEFILAKR